MKYAVMQFTYHSNNRKSLKWQLDLKKLLAEGIFIELILISSVNQIKILKIKETVSFNCSVQEFKAVTTSAPVMVKIIGAHFGVKLMHRLIF